MWTRLPVEPASIKMPKVVASSRSTTSYLLLAAACRTRSGRRRIGACAAPLRCRAGGKVCCGKRGRNAVGAAAAAAGVQLRLLGSASVSTLLLWPARRSKTNSRHEASVLMPLARRSRELGSAIRYDAERLPEEQGQPASLAAPQSEAFCVQPFGQGSSGLLWSGRARRQGCTRRKQSQ